MWHDIATSPIFQCGLGYAKRSVVLRVVTYEDDQGRRQLKKFVVHDRYWYEDMADSYGNGHYFLADRYETPDEAFRLAFAKWQERSKEVSERYPLAELTLLLANSLKETP